LSNFIHGACAVRTSARRRLLDEKLKKWSVKPLAQEMEFPQTVKRSITERSIAFVEENSTFENGLIYFGSKQFYANII
jgi:hypothetical protein